MRIAGQQLKLVGVIASLCCAIVGLSNISVSIANHPFHVSTAEVEFNDKTQRLEVALKCQTTDLERALRLMAGKKIDIEDDPQIDILVTSYLTENFYLAQATAEPEKAKKISDATPSSKLMPEVPNAPKEPVKLIGKEFETKWIWIYFELQPPAGEQPLVLVNRVLFEVNTGQINTCLIRHAGQRNALKSTANKPLQDFDRKWLVGSTVETSR